MRLLRFIGHPNGIVLRFFKRKRPTTVVKQIIVPRHETAHELSSYSQQYSNEFLNELLSETLPPKGLIRISLGSFSSKDFVGETEKEIETDQQGAKQLKRVK